MGLVFGVCVDVDVKDRKIARCENLHAEVDPEFTLDNSESCRITQNNYWRLVPVRM